MESVCGRRYLASSPVFGRKRPPSRGEGIPRRLLGVGSFRLQEIVAWKCQFEYNLLRQRLAYPLAAVRAWYNKWTFLR